MKYRVYIEGKNVLLKKFDKLEGIDGAEMYAKAMSMRDNQVMVIRKENGVTVDRVDEVQVTE